MGGGCTIGDGGLELLGDGGCWVGVAGSASGAAVESVMGSGWIVSAVVGAVKRGGEGVGGVAVFGEVGRSLVCRGFYSGVSESSRVSGVGSISGRFRWYKGMLLE